MKRAVYICMAILCCWVSMAKGSFAQDITEEQESTEEQEEPACGVTCQDMIWLEEYLYAGDGVFIIPILAPITVPVIVLTSDEKGYYIGIEPIYNSTSLIYELEASENAHWSLSVPAVAISAGIATPNHYWLAMRLEAEFMYGAFNGEDIADGHAVSNHRQFVFMLNFYHDIPFFNTGLAFYGKTALGVAVNTLDVKLAGTNEYKHFSETAPAWGMGMGLIYTISPQHSVDFDFTVLFLSERDTVSEASSLRFGLAYKYWF
ncbi:MAG: hypothetical protein LBV04_06785 [Deferribacteraceae bacterium]|jgi:hypothetical protein|nr:hypothetical protein [Deferribacteraceae bacterium]